MIKRISVLLVFSLLMAILLSFPVSASSDENVNTLALDATGMIKVTQPSSTIITAPTLISYINSQADLAKAVSELPSTALMRVDSSLNVSAPDKSVISTLSAAITALNNKVIPGFYVNDNASAKAVIEYLETIALEDVTFFSSEAAVIKYIRTYWTDWTVNTSNTAAKEQTNSHRIYRAVLDRTALTQTELNVDELAKLRDEANTACTKIIMLPAKLAKYQYVEALQKYLMTVWVQANAGISSNGDAAWLINSGANGILSDNTSLFKEVFTKFYGANSFTRTPFIIAHRGASAEAPENTMASFKLAYENGADLIEMDVNYTKDNQLIIIHDETLKRTTSSTDDFVATNVNSLTLEQVRSVYVNAGYTGAYATERVPLLSEVLTEFKGKDVQVYVEFKSADKKLGTMVANMIKQYGMEKQVSILTYSNWYYEARQGFNSILPGLSVSKLNGAAIKTGQSTTDALYASSDMYTVLKQVLWYNSTISSQSDYFSLALMQALSHRGMTAYPWMVTNTTFDSFFLYGTTGMTTNYSYQAKSMVKKLLVDVNEYNIGIGQAQKIAVESYTYNKVKTNVTSSAELVELENTCGAVCNDGTVSASKAGKYVFMWKYAGKTAQTSKSYYVYSQPVTVNVLGSDNDLQVTDASGYTVEYSSKTVSNVKADTTVSTFFAGFKNKTVKAFSSTGTELSSTAFIGSGAVIKAYDGTNEVDALTVSVSGDTDGDGQIKENDYLTVKLYFKKGIELKDAYAKAADTDGNGIISITDYIAIKRHIAGSYKL